MLREIQLNSAKLKYCLELRRPPIGIQVGFVTEYENFNLNRVEIFIAGTFSELLRVSSYTHLFSI